MNLFHVSFLSKFDHQQIAKTCACFYSSHRTLYQNTRAIILRPEFFYRLKLGVVQILVLQGDLGNLCKT